MREALFIFVVIAILFGLTLFRYRKQIFAFLEFTRAIRGIGGPATKDTLRGENASADTALVNCSTCGVWSPQTRSRKLGSKFYCSDECLATRTK